MYLSHAVLVPIWLKISMLMKTNVSYILLYHHVNILYSFKVIKLFNLTSTSEAWQPAY